MQAFLSAVDGIEPPSADPPREVLVLSENDVSYRGVREGAESQSGELRVSRSTAPVNPAAGAGRRRAGGPQAVPASAAGIRAMLENAASPK